MLPNSSRHPPQLKRDSLGCSTMVIENVSGSVELEISVPDGPGQGRRARVGVAWGDFRATRAGVWFEHGEFEAFLEDLRTLDRTRRGRAVLAADDPREFHLAFAAMDKPGHLQITGRLATNPARDGAAALEFEFPLDPSALPGVLRDFERTDAAA